MTTYTVKSRSPAKAHAHEIDAYYVAGSNGHNRLGFRPAGTIVKYNDFGGVSTYIVATDTWYVGWEHWPQYDSDYAVDTYASLDEARSAFEARR